jgi:hypothetical protein
VDGEESGLNDDVLDSVSAVPGERGTAFAVGYGDGQNFSARGIAEVYC